MSLYACVPSIRVRGGGDRAQNPPPLPSFVRRVACTPWRAQCRARVACGIGPSHPRRSPQLLPRPRLPQPPRHRCCSCSFFTVPARARYGGAPAVAAELARRLVPTLCPLAQRTRAGAGRRARCRCRSERRSGFEACSRGGAPSTGERLLWLAYPSTCRPRAAAIYHTHR